MFPVTNVDVLGDIADAEGAWHHMGDWAWPMMGLGWLVGLGLIGLLVWLVVATVRDRSTAGAGPTAVDLLDERYARGEIDRDDYLQRRQDLLS